MVSFRNCNKVTKDFSAEYVERQIWLALCLCIDHLKALEESINH